MNKAIHCNLCFEILDFKSGPELFLLSCQHVLCSNCSKPGICVICRVPAKSIPIDAQMPRNIRKFLMDTESKVTEAVDTESFQLEKSSDRFLKNSNSSLLEMSSGSSYSTVSTPSFLLEKSNNGSVEKGFANIISENSVKNSVFGSDFELQPKHHIANVFENSLVQNPSKSSKSPKDTSIVSTFDLTFKEKSKPISSKSSTLESPLFVPNFRASRSKHSIFDLGSNSKFNHLALISDDESYDKKRFDKSGYLKNHPKNKFSDPNFKLNSEAFVENYCTENRFGSLKTPAKSSEILISAIAGSQVETSHVSNRCVSSNNQAGPSKKPFSAPRVTKRKLNLETKIPHSNRSIFSENAKFAKRGRPSQEN
ncbi:uncharacterized protein LOC134834372 [Culicoides brevitarsis]|uniref:uncharacterized protein LOC134834372 n=1 Tax=Culicoides brevitarsis TaxID=469753 RepID=UPI00307C18FF